MKMLTQKQDFKENIAQQILLKKTFDEKDTSPRSCSHQMQFGEPVNFD